MFVDFAGETVPIVDPVSGEIEHAYVYVAVLGASNYTYAEATMAQDLESWVALTRNALEFFEGSAEIWVPDNLKAGVSRTCRYEPDINPVYSEMAEYYGAAVIPARLGRTRDKAKVDKFLAKSFCSIPPQGIFRLLSHQGILDPIALAIEKQKVAVMD
jgi:transposase